MAKARRHAVRRVAYVRTKRGSSATVAGTMTSSSQFQTVPFSGNPVQDHPKP